MTPPRSLTLPDPDTGISLLAISGGMDSVVLLHMLVNAGFQNLVLCHFNHGLRGRESGQDAAFVRRLAARHGLACEVEKADVAAIARSRRMSVELAARTLRYDFLSRMAGRHGAREIYLAHHADDQAETILANLCRGTGIGGLKGMLEESPDVPVLRRPLLGLSRKDLAAYAAAHQLKWREDASNQSPAYRRNRVRHEVLPLLKNVYARDVSPLIVRLGKQAGRDDDCLCQMAREFAREHTLVEADGSLKLVPEMRKLHPAVLSRVLHQWLGERLEVAGLDAGLVEQAMEMVMAGGPAKVNLAQGRHLRRKNRRLWVESP